MKSLRFALLLLIAAAPLASAAEWLNWRKTGDATLTWGPFTVYTSQLRTPQRRYIAADQDQALILTYARDITRDELVDATREQWRALGILTREAQSETWLHTLATLWPDVSSGTQLAFVLREKRGQFWYRASAAEKTFTPLGPQQSLPFSINFLAIWLDPHTQYPTLRQQLIGGEK